MAWTQSDLDQIKDNIKTGALEIQHGDKRIRFRNLADMLQTKRLIEKELGIKKSRPSRRTAVTSKGL